MSFIRIATKTARAHILSRLPPNAGTKIRMARLGLEKRLYRHRISYSEFRQALLDLGEWRGRTVWVQSSWNQFYNVDMKPTEIIDMMLDFVGARGTLAMPAFPLRDDPLRVLDIDREPASTGLIAELFRRYPGVFRSIHLRSSVAALGPYAGYLTEAHHLTEYPWGPITPYGRIRELRGLMVSLGFVRLGFTPLHYAECVLHHDVPRFEKVFDGTVQYRWRKRNGDSGEHVFLNRVGRISPKRLIRHFPRDLYREHRISNLRLMASPAQEAIDLVCALAKENKTMYID